MKLTKELLRQHNIYNSWEIAQTAHKRFFLNYVPQDTGRRGDSAKWQVEGLRFQTDPKASWRDYGRKTFGVFGRDDKAVKFAQAVEWIKETYAENMTEKDPFGGWHSEGTLKIIADKIAQGVNVDG